MIRRRLSASEIWAILLLTTMVVLAGARALAFRMRKPVAEVESIPDQTNPYAGKILPEAKHEQVAELCAACHVYPPPDSIARHDWPGEVERGFAFLAQSDLKTRLVPPPPVEVARYYLNRAPATLPPPSRPPAGELGRFRFERISSPGDGGGSPMIANVRFAHLFDERRLDVLACDMDAGHVVAWKPYEPSEAAMVLAEGLKNPCHAEVVDLDQDGVRDVLVADLGSRWPGEERQGSVVWLRGNRDGRFTRRIIADGLGRVADAQAADFDGDGDLDVVAAVFGYIQVGEILYLENRTTDPDAPTFVPRTLDARDGTIHVPIADLNGDGRPDFVALISQEHEIVEAFLNEGEGQFSRRTIYAAPHPAFSSNGIQLVDFDRDGDLDVLMTNGDVLERRVLKPYQGIHWLENRGDYPFEPHRLDSLYGVARAVAGDLDGDGDLDIAATTFLPGGHWSRVRPSLDSEAIVVLEQTEPGAFVRHELESETCDHPSCDLGDFDGDGRLDLVTSSCIFLDPGEMSAPKGLDGIIVHKGLGPDVARGDEEE
jgi:hypothetical protein